MEKIRLKELLEEFKNGNKDCEQIADELKKLHVGDYGIAKYDHQRPLRNGFSEVIFCEGKREDHLLKILFHLNEEKKNVFGTRADNAIMQKISDQFPNADCDKLSRTFTIINKPIDLIDKKVSVLCAGTADISVAEEACRTLRYFGIEASRHYDVGVAGLHRLIGVIPEIENADCILVVAGMEGALPSVVGGLVAAPIIAIPTSVGYGASFDGISALLGMLNSCSEGISVVNIDSGFGGACAAVRIIKNTRGC